MEWGSEGMGKQESFITVARTADVLEDTRFVCPLRVSAGKGMELPAMSYGMRVAWLARVHLRCVLRHVRTGVNERGKMSLASVMPNAVDIEDILSNQRQQLRLVDK